MKGPQELKTEPTLQVYQYHDMNTLCEAYYRFIVSRDIQAATPDTIQCMLHMWKEGLCWVTPEKL